MNLLQSFVVVACCLLYAALVSAQERGSETPFGTMVVVGMKTAPFPHPARSGGYTYNGKFFPAAKHYSDSSVAIMIPRGVEIAGTLDVIVYLHGWNNTIDSANEQFRLFEQCAASQKNAVLVFPEGPANAPDSFGGKLEDPDGLKNLLTEVVGNLERQREHKSSLSIGKIILAGHSGAYRAIAAMLDRGGMAGQIHEVWLFDALYGQSDVFLRWIETDMPRVKGRFITIYTDGGGTKEQTEKLIAELRKRENSATAIVTAEELTVDANAMKQILKQPGTYFIHTDLTHNGVIAQRQQFQRYAETSCLQALQTIPSKNTNKKK